MSIEKKELPPTGINWYSKCNKCAGWCNLCRVVVISVIVVICGGDVICVVAVICVTA